MSSSAAPMDILFDTALTLANQRQAVQNEKVQVKYREGLREKLDALVDVLTFGEPYTDNSDFRKVKLMTNNEYINLYVNQSGTFAKIKRSRGKAVWGSRRLGRLVYGYIKKYTTLEGVPEIEALTLLRST